MTNYTVSSGVTSSGITLHSGDGMVVLSGGTALATTSDPGGQTVDLGGTAISTTLEAGGLQDLNGIAIDTTIDSGGQQFVNVFSGQGIASNTRVNDLGIMFVDGGGAAIGAFVASGGVADVSAGGTAVGTIITSGGFEDIAASGLASDTIISGGSLYLESGAVESGPIIFAGSGGILVIGGTGMPSSGTAALLPSGVISGLAVGDTIDLTDVSFASGGGIYLDSGDTLHVSGGGYTLSGGSQYVLQLDPATNLSGASFRLMSDGGSGTDIKVVSGLSINVGYDPSVITATSATRSGIMSGVSAAVDYLESTFTNPVTLNIDVGYGEFNGSALDSGALGENGGDDVNPFPYSAVVSALKANGSSSVQSQAYGTLPATSPDNGTLWLDLAEQQVLGLASANSVAVNGYVGFSTSDSFSYASGVTPPSSAFYFVGVAEHEFSEVMGRTSELDENINGSASYSIMDLFRYSSSGTRQTSTGDPSYFSINSGASNLDNWNNLITGNDGDLGDWAPSAGNDAFLDNSDPGVVNEVTSTDVTLMNVLGWNVPPVVDSGIIYVSFGETSAGIIIVSGGTLAVQSGGTANATVLSSGGNLFVSSGGIASGTTVSNGGFEVILPGGSAAASVLPSGGYEYIYPGGFASGADVAGGAIQNDDGTASATTLGGFQIIFSGASATATSITSTGYQYILPGGLASGTTVASGGIENVDGVASGTILSGFQVIFAGASAINTSITSTGYQYILPGGTASSTTVAHGGIQNDDGVADNTTLSGTQIVFSGALASGLTIASGGYEYVLPGGAVGGTIMSSGGFLNDDGTANATVISSGSEELVFAGATAGSTTVDAGGFLIVVSGGLMSATTITGGFAELGGGNGAGSGAITFASGAGGMLQFDDAQHFAGKLSGFGLPDQLDLRDIAFGSNTVVTFSEAASNLSGTLSATDGTHSAGITLLGSYSPAQFHSANDGAGGTLITDPPVSTPNPVLWQSTPDTLAAASATMVANASVTSPEGAQADSGFAHLIQSLAAGSPSLGGFSLTTTQQPSNDPPLFGTVVTRHLGA